MPAGVTLRFDACQALLKGLFGHLAFTIPGATITPRLSVFSL
jgi:hypothetical protein